MKMKLKKNLTYLKNLPYSYNNKDLLVIVNSSLYSLLLYIKVEMH